MAGLLAKTSGTPRTYFCRYADFAASPVANCVNTGMHIILGHLSRTHLATRLETRLFIYHSFILITDRLDSHEQHRTLAVQHTVVSFACHICNGSTEKIVELSLPLTKDYYYYYYYCTDVDREGISLHFLFPFLSTC